MPSWRSVMSAGEGEPGKTAWMRWSSESVPAAEGVVPPVCHGADRNNNELAAAPGQYRSTDSVGAAGQPDAIDIVETTQGPVQA